MDGTFGLFKVLGPSSELPLEKISATSALVDLNVQDKGVGPSGRSDIDFTYKLNKATPTPPKQPRRRISLSRQEKNAFFCFMNVILAFSVGKSEQQLRSGTHASRDAGLNKAL